MKSLLLLPLLTLGLFFTSCKKEEIIQQEVVIPNKTIVFEVAKEDWGFDASVGTNVVKLDIPELDDYTNQNAGVLVYASADRESFEALPSVFGGITFTFRHNLGELYIETQNANGATVGKPQATIYFKVVIIESDPID